MPYNFKQCTESQVDSCRYTFFNEEQIRSDFQDLFDRFLDGETQNLTDRLDNFPPDADIKNDEEMVNQEIWQSLSAQQPSTQPGYHDQFLPQHPDSSESEQSSQEQVVETAKPDNKSRSTKDGHVLSQNMGSKARSLICKLMSRNKTKSFKKSIKELYTKFLKESGFSNSQVVLLFSYLFLIKNHVPRIIYSEFRHIFLQYLYAKRVQAGNKPDREIRDGLFAKINTNIQLADYLFSLRDPWDLDFRQVQAISSPLFTGRQTKVIEKPLKKASQMYEEIIPTIIKTSNTSTGCQVEL